MIFVICMWYVFFTCTVYIRFEIKLVFLKSLWLSWFLKQAFCKLIYIILYPSLKNWRIHGKETNNQTPTSSTWILQDGCEFPDRFVHLSTWPWPRSLGDSDLTQMVAAAAATVGLSKGDADVKDIQGRRVKWWHRPPLNHWRWQCCVISGSCLVDTLSHVVCVGRWRSKDMTEKCLHSWDADVICERMWLIRNSKIDDSNFPVPTGSILVLDSFGGITV